MKKFWVLYICTWKYDVFRKEFYDSCEKYLLTEWEFETVDGIILGPQIISQCCALIKTVSFKFQLTVPQLALKINIHHVWIFILLHNATELEPQLIVILSQISPIAYELSIFELLNHIATPLILDTFVFSEEIITWFEALPVLLFHQR